MLPIDNPTKSYWIEATESQLKNFQSTPELPKETDVVIIGSGYTGASAAYWLHKHTQKTNACPRMLMLEARDICGGATGRNGGQLRPHAYSRYQRWKGRFGAETALALIKHEMAHLPAFKEMLEEEGISEETCVKFGETFDAAMTEEAWARLKGNYDEMKADHGAEDEVVAGIRIIEDAREAEEFTQMKGCIAAVVHAAGQIWPYKFVHALLNIVLETGRLNLQANTPALAVSQKDEAGWISVKTARGDVRAKAVVHATNRWAGHLLPEMEKLIRPCRATVGAVKAPANLMRNTGAQHWDNYINNYYCQIPAPHNTLIIGGAQPVLVQDPDSTICNDREDQRIDRVAEFFQQWPETSITDWRDGKPAELSLPVDEGGNWTGTESSSIDSFPFVGPVPGRTGHFLVAGFTGHGMPRILLSTAHITPLVLKSLDVHSTAPDLVLSYPALPKPFEATAERIERLQAVDTAPGYAAEKKGQLESAKKSFCRGWDITVKAVPATTRRDIDPTTSKPNY